ncbi:jg18479 [Pararge aegeria aegeria]|uniref:Jg18479 protein n=1 Tax=Pararge aegeria aegeria TaxID=348720 RepID=A0A8S4RP57_9NEOP|nr:jg18479 [Pararge aegeria aegeria]
MLVQIFSYRKFFPDYGAKEPQKWSSGGVNGLLQHLEYEQLMVLANLAPAYAELKRSITVRPLCRACMEADETPTHVLLRCRGVAEQRAAYLGSPASLPEALCNLGGWLE